MLLGSSGKIETPGGLKPMVYAHIENCKYALSNRRLYALRMFKKERRRFNVDAPVLVRVEFRSNSDGGASTRKNQGTSGKSYKKRQ